MPRVVPSHVVAYLDAAFGDLILPPKAPGIRYEAGHATVIGPLVRLIDEIPGELLALIPADEYVQYVAAVAAMRVALESWQYGAHPGHQTPLVTLQAYKRHPLTIVRDVLADCPDEAPALATRDLAFLADPDLEGDLRLDLSHAYAELADREFKSATVLAGSAIEALLFWAVGHKTSGQITAAAAAVGKAKLSPTLVRWALDDLLKVSEHFGLVSAQTAKACDAAKDFRNLIHAERAARLGQRANQATAMSAVAAVLHVLGDIEGWVAAGKP